MRHPAGPSWASVAEIRARVSAFDRGANVPWTSEEIVLRVTAPGHRERAELTPSLQHDLTDEIVRRIEPTEATLEMPFLECPHEPRCARALGAADRHDLERAWNLVEGALNDALAIQPPDPYRLRTVLVDHAAVNILAGRLDAARGDLLRSARLGGGWTIGCYDIALTLQRLLAERRALVEQGIAATSQVVPGASAN